MSKLIILEGPDAGAKFSFDSGRLLIGRGDECQIRINQGSISRHHAALTFMGDCWQIEDLNSQNGVFIDGVQISRQRLTSSTRLRLGTINVQFEAGPELQQQAVSASQEAVRSAGAVSMDDIGAIGSMTTSILDEFGRVIIGQKQVAEELLIAIAAGGHCLMIGLPGLAKTLMVSTLAQILQLQFKRVQFTPDLMPSDIIGTDVLDIDEQTGRKNFRFIKGPIFTNMLLADEINRTPPKTQAALLEAMQEKQVTASNQMFKLPPPFFVLATQNPLEQEGTYPLPEAQLDRFMFNILVDYPAAEEEEAIVMATTSRRDIKLRQVLGAEELVRLQAVVRDLPVSPHVVKYATRLVRMTRPGDAEAPDFIRTNIHCGAGPRAAQCLVLGAKARAVLHGRLNVSCSDVRALALPVLRHRIFTNFSADSEGITADTLVNRLLEAVPEPDAKDY
ncbi:MAG: AAA family ATPase [Victivallales bacterium]|nr:AAA family ATPase [Victivallales bacterium]